MGTWGHGNLDSDSASDILYARSKELVEETLELAGSKLATECDEYDYDKLFVNFELLFALERARLLRYYPEPEQLVGLKGWYLAAWDAYMKKNGNEWNERRAVISKTFDRLIWISEKEKRRVESLPQWVEVKPPAVSELSDDLSLSPHLVFGHLHISIPTSWNAQTWNGIPNLPNSTLTHSLLESGAGHYVVKGHRFSLERVFFASGTSLVPEELDTEDNPYLLIGRLRILGGAGMPDVYGLVCDSVETLSPRFQGEGEHVSGVICIDALEEFAFDGLESFRRIRGTRLRYKNLYYHKLSEDILLLLETGSIQDNRDFHFPGKVLLEHIVDSMRATS